MKFLITGGFGFIGQHLIQKILLDDNNQIIIVDKLSKQVHGNNYDYSTLTENPRISFIQADICNPEVIKFALGGVDTIVHLAAETGTGQSMYCIQDYFGTNVLGTATILEELVKMTGPRPTRFILASSRSVYGEGAYVKESQVGSANSKRYYPRSRKVEDMKAGHFNFTLDGELLTAVPTNEADPTDPQSLYAVSKLTQELMCEVACKSMDISFVALRFQNVYGPKQSLKNPYTGIISIFINILRQGGVVDIFEDGEETRDFVFVNDVVNALYSACGHESFGHSVINVGTGVPCSVYDLVCMLEDKMGVRDRKVISGRFRIGDIRHNFADVSRMKQYFDIERMSSLRDGLSATVDWALTQPVEEDRTKIANEELARLQGS